MNTLPLLLKREFWEHRGGFLWAPVWTTGAILILTIVGIISAEVFRSHANVQFNFLSYGELRDAITDDQIAKASNALDMVQFVFTAIACVALFFVTFFYLLGALYDDRRDRSVLFWKSLPVSDTATVVSKVLTATLVMPIIALLVATAAYAVFLVLSSAWVGVHGLNPLPAVLAAHPFGMFVRMAAMILVSALWALPTVGWLMFWSAYARSKPFMWAVLIPIMALFANAWLGFLGAPHFGNEFQFGHVLLRLVLSIVPGSWMSEIGLGLTHERISFNMNDDHVLHALDPGNIYAVLATANLWIGVVAGVLLLAAATWFRRTRIETAT